MNQLRVTAAVTTLVALGIASAGSAGAFGFATAAAGPALYSLRATTSCLQARGAKVERVRPLDAQRRQLRDLAQRNSREARVKQQSVGLAFGRSEADAKLLVELLTVPKDVYRLARRKNVVLMYKPASRGAFTMAVKCLRS